MLAVLSKFVFLFVLDKEYWCLICVCVCEIRFLSAIATESNLPGAGVVGHDVGSCITCLEAA